MEIREYQNFDEVEKSLIKEIIRWSELSFGKGYLTTEYLKVLMSKAILLVAYYDSIPTGTALLKKETREEVRPELRPKLKQDSQAIYRKFILVKPEARQSGTAKALYAKIAELASEVDMVYSSIWQQEKISTYANNLLNDGYSSSAVIEDYWKEDSIERKFICAECKLIPCTCSAQLFYQLKT